MNHHLTLVARDYSKDAGLARRASSGDRGAQHELFRTLKTGVHATPYRVLGSNEHMEDLLQDAFIEVFRSLPRYSGESQLDTWAARLGARVAFHQLKHKPERADASPRPVQLHLVVSPEDNDEHRAGRERLYEVLRRMKPEHHVTLALSVLDGRSPEEIAEITGVNVATAKHRASRARRKLWAAARRDPALMGYLSEQGGAEVMGRPSRPFSLPVAPLSRHAWERVETRVFERLGRGEHLPSESLVVRGPAPVRVWLVAAALVLIATVSLWWGLDRLHHHHPVANEPVGPLAGLSAAPPSSLEEGLQSIAPEPRESTRIITTKAPIRTLLGEAVLTLGAHADVSVRGTEAAGWVVELAAGTIECSVAPRRGRPPFVVEAGKTRVSVIGSRFSVTRSGAGARVSVSEGLVRAESPGVEVELGPGEEWPDPTPAAPPHRRQSHSPGVNPEGAEGLLERWEQ